MAGMLRKMLSDNVLLDLGKQRRLVEAAADSVTVDEGLKLLDLAASRCSRWTPDSIEFQTVPNARRATATPRAGSIVRLEDEKALKSLLRATCRPSRRRRAGARSPRRRRPSRCRPPTSPSPCYNGSGTSGLAADAAKELEGRRVRRRRRPATRTTATTRPTEIRHRRR